MEVDHYWRSIVGCPCICMRALRTRCVRVWGVGCVGVDHYWRSIRGCPCSTQDEVCGGVVCGG